jgi:outer membrane receptor protein involved in Fe transport
VSFITHTVVDRQRITQTVVSAEAVGEAPFFRLPGGPIGLAVGTEWRREDSRADFNPYDEGILPAGTPFTPGDHVSNVSNNVSLGFNGGTSRVFDSYGEYDVWEVFGEARLPILSEAPFAHELEFDAAYRYSDYSTSGGTETWNLGLVWAPIADVRFRGSLSQAVRAPNIGELFSPAQPGFFRPQDPCDANVLDAFEAADPVTGAIRRANCLAALQALGMTPAEAAAYVDPLSARFPGEVSGNPDLDPETADTVTVGVVVQPSFLRGLVFTVDYWNIDIADAIAAPSAQDIVDNCYDSPTFPGNPYCPLFDRNPDSGSPQWGGFTFLRTQPLNFGAVQAEGVDFSVRYNWSMFGSDFTAALAGTRQNNIDFFFDPGDPSAVDPELGELFRPEWFGNFSLLWNWDRLQVGWNVQYHGEQLLGGGGIVSAPEIETYETLFGPTALQDPVYLHDLSARYDFNDNFLFFGGVQNLTDEDPFITEIAWPAGPRGRVVFVGVNARW